MYVYCIAPSGKLKSNFIKIGFCNDFNSLKKRYSTYYGLIISYHVKVDLKKREFEIHEELKNMRLHIIKELFIYDDDNYNYDFYKKKLDELSKKCENKIIEGNNVINTKETKNNITEDLFQNYEEDIVKSTNKLTISEKSNKENANDFNKKDKKNNNKFYKLEKAISFFEESINSRYDKNYNDIYINSVLFDIVDVYKKNDKEIYNKICKMHKKTNNYNDLGKFNQQIKRCNMFIKTLDKIEEYKNNKIKINFTELSPLYFRKLDSEFKLFITYLEKKYGLK